MRTNVLTYLGAMLFLTGCGGPEKPPPTGTPPRPYEATIQWTSYGIPHVVAEDLGGLGFGFAQASAPDIVCTLADQIVKVKSERAKFFGEGPGNQHVTSDFAYLTLGLVERATQSWEGLDPDAKELIEGYAAGYNAYLEKTGADALPAPCKGAAWVKPVSPQDLLAYYLDLALRNSSGAVVNLIGNAVPPGGNTFAPDFDSLSIPHVFDADLGSNAWAIGRDRTENKRGILLANPHFNWEGELRFYEAHLKVPGKLDVYGAGLLGSPVINIGFNENVAWTHTVTPSVHFTAYKLALDPTDPTTYMYEGAPRKMESRTFTIDVLNSDKSTTPMSRTLYRSHYGPMLGGSGIPWLTDKAFSIRDANIDDVRIIEQWLRMGQAANVAELRKAQEDVQGVPWSYTIAADAQGDTLFIDSSRVPNLSAVTLTAYDNALASGDPFANAFADGGIMLLDGSIARDEWVETPEGGYLVPPAVLPALARTDFVMNANGSPWITNPAELLTSYPLHYGPIAAPISSRTRMNLILLTEEGPNAASGADHLFTLAEVQSAILSNRGIAEERLRGSVVARCQATPSVVVKGMTVDLTAACNALAAWDGKLDTASVGAVLWREFLGQFPTAATSNKGELYDEAFDPSNPLDTPRTLIPAPSGTDPILVAIAGALDTLSMVGLGPTTPLGMAQFTRKGDTTIPIHGGVPREGTANIVSFVAGGNTTLLPKLAQTSIVNPATSLTTEGYLINSGTSFLMALEFATDGPHASAVLTYSQSNDPASPQFADQTKLFSEKSWRAVLFRDADIKADSSFVEQVVRR